MTQSHSVVFGINFPHRRTNRKTIAVAERTSLDFFFPESTAGCASMVLSASFISPVGSIADRFDIRETAPCWIGGLGRHEPGSSLGSLGMLLDGGLANAKNRRCSPDRVDNGAVRRSNGRCNTPHPVLRLSEEPVDVFCRQLIVVFFFVGSDRSEGRLYWNDLDVAGCRGGSNDGRHRNGRAADGEEAEIFNEAQLCGTAPG